MNDADKIRPKLIAFDLDFTVCKSDSYNHVVGFTILFGKYLFSVL